MPVGNDILLGRVARARAEMERRSLDCLVIFSNPASFGIGRGTLGHIRYLTDWTDRFNASVLLLFRDARIEAVLLVPMLFDLPVAVEQDLWVKDVRCEPPNDQGRVARRLLFDAQAKRVGLVGADEMSAPPYLDLVNPGGPVFEAADDLLVRLRTVKAPEELALQRKAALYADQMVTALAESARRDGEWAWKLMVEAEHSARMEGCEYVGVWLSTGAAIDRPRFLLRENLRRVQPGDQLLMGTYIIFEGYVGHSIRMGFKGRPDPKYRALHATAVAVKEAGSQELIAGRDLRSSVAAMADTIELRLPGVQNPYPFRSAHGLGLDYDDQPLSKAVPQPAGWYGSSPRPQAQEVTLEAGMTLELHPNMADPRIGFAALGDMYLVAEEGGPERLTQFPTDPFEC